MGVIPSFHINLHRQPLQPSPSVGATGWSPSSFPYPTLNGPSHLLAQHPPRITNPFILRLPCSCEGRNPLLTLYNLLPSPPLPTPQKCHFAHCPQTPALLPSPHAKLSQQPRCQGLSHPRGSRNPPPPGIPPMQIESTQNPPAQAQILPLCIAPNFSETNPTPEIAPLRHGFDFQIESRSGTRHPETNTKLTQTNAK